LVLFSEERWRMTDAGCGMTDAGWGMTDVRLSTWETGVSKSK
jgi:hypothetical protein